MRCAGYVLRSASVLGTLGSSIAVWAPAQGLSLRNASDDKLISGDGLRKMLVKLATHVDPNALLQLPPSEPSLRVQVRQRAARRAVRALLMRTRLRLVRSGWPQSWWRGITTTWARRLCGCAIGLTNIFTRSKNENALSATEILVDNVWA